VIARSGRIGYAPSECGFFCEAVTEDGRTLLSRYYPDNMFLEETVHHLRCTGDLYNDSDVAVMLTDASVIFWGPQGPVIQHTRPRIIVGNEEPAVIAVPAHGRTAITVILPLLREELDTKYASTLPVLRAQDISGRNHEFRLSPTSFHGSLAAWSRPGRLPIMLLDGLAEAAETDEATLLGDAAPDLRMPTVNEDRSGAV
jgi:hypothetical protein